MNISFLLLVHPAIPTFVKLAGYDLQGRTGVLSYREYVVSGALPLPSYPFPFPPVPSSPLLSLPFPSLSSPFLPFPSLTFPSQPQNGPQNLAKSLGSAVSSHNGVRGGAPAANAFLAYFQPSKRIRRQRFWFLFYYSSSI